MAMSVEFLEVDSTVEWHAGTAEKIGVGVSALLLGGAFFFPETGTFLPSAAGAIALLDLAYIGLKSLGNGIDNDISRMNQNEMTSWADN